MNVSLNVERNAAGRFDYIVTTASGFRAVIERCDRDACADGSIAECRRQLNHRGQHETGGKSSVDAWLRHAKTHCHGWHDGRVADFVAAVARSYGSYKPLRLTRPTAPRISVSDVAAALGVTLDEARWLAKPVEGVATPVDLVATALGITVDEYRAQLALAGASC
jgi:hypothetical protein